MEKSRAIFPCFILQYNFRWKIFHAIRLEIQEYIKKLKNPETQEDRILRRNFLIKMNFIAQQ